MSHHQTWTSQASLALSTLMVTIEQLMLKGLRPALNAYNPHSTNLPRSWVTALCLSAGFLLIEFWNIKRDVSLNREFSEY